MLKTVSLNQFESRDGFDYKLENGELLHASEWNGEYYETENGIFRPVYKEDADGNFEAVGFEN